jgi:hypothetical protein
VSFEALTCPQCGGPLPRQALWRHVSCPHCKAVVTRAQAVVRRAGFRDALERSRGPANEGGRVLSAGGVAYAILAPLGRGDHSEVLLGERTGPLRARVTIKRAEGDAAAARLRREAATLRALQALEIAGSAYFSQRLPQPVHAGAAVLDGVAQEVLVLRHPTGHWGSLAAVREAQPRGVDARHIVWMWRRVLETLAYRHGAGWVHGDLGLDHLLVQPAQHGVRIIGWSRAVHETGAALERGRARDLQQLAWSMRALLHGTGDGVPDVPATTPAPLASLLRQASDGAASSPPRDAASLERALGEAAAASCGPPRGVPFDPLGGRATAA